MSWQIANRVAHIAATQAHDDLAVDPGLFPIQVAPAIHHAGITLMYQPMTKGFGFYLVKDRGILINRGLTRSARRHTAAHELGHHHLGHDPDRADHPCTIDTVGGPASIRNTGWSADEKAAEAFATWFLMPPGSVRAALAAFGTPGPVNPAHVYQLSLLLGTSFRATARHLVSLRLLNYQTATHWAKSVPGDFKRQLIPAGLPSTRDVDVWQIDRLVGDTTIYTSVDDLFIVRDPAQITHLGDGLMTAAESSVPGLTVLAVGNPRCDTSVSLRTPAASARTISLVPEPRPLGIYPHGTENFDGFEDIDDQGSDPA